jgi:uncharacterized protein YbdZ (MbtH family)
VICYADEAEKKAALDAERTAGAEAERQACIRWLELEAANALNPAHARCLRDVAHDLRTGAHHKP